MTLFEIISGISISEIITKCWSSMENPPKICVLGRRIHHGEIGVLLLLISLFSRSKKAEPHRAFLIGFSIGLIIDDSRDINEWFKTDIQNLNLFRTKYEIQ
jgi:hypothetical protein